MSGFDQAVQASFQGSGAEIIRPSGTGINADPVHRRKVDHQPAVADRVSRIAVAAAPHGDLEPFGSVLDIR